MDGDDSQPLLRQSRETEENNGETTVRHRIKQHRLDGQRILSSRKKHFIVMALVTLDVAAVLANIFIQLIACETHQGDEPWVLHLVEALEKFGLVISCLFMVELAACLFSYGPRYDCVHFGVEDAG